MGDSVTAEDTHLSILLFRQIVQVLEHNVDTQELVIYYQQIWSVLLSKGHIMEEKKSSHDRARRTSMRGGRLGGRNPSSRDSFGRKNEVKETKPQKVRGADAKVSSQALQQPYAQKTSKKRTYKSKSDANTGMKDENPSLTANPKDFKHCAYSKHPPHELSNDVREFLNNLDQALTTNKPIRISNDEIAMWMECWKVAATHNIKYNETLLYALSKIPAAASNMPPIDYVIGIIKKHLETIEKQPIVDNVTTLEMIVDLLRNHVLVCCTLVSSNNETMVRDTKTAFQITVGSLFSKMPEQAGRLTPLISSCDRVFNEIDKHVHYIPRMLTAGPLLPSIRDVNDIMGWKEGATLRWLLCPSWHNIRGLESGYSTPEEYASALQRVWTLLTFYWGAGAVYPKCRHVYNGKQCSIPLLCSIRESEIRPCTFRGGTCTKNAVFRCHMNHHDAICQDCLSIQHHRLIGSDRGASTDIYDAFVDRESINRDSTVYHLTRVVSRNPPQISPNWRTTYRLSVSALVGVVRLNVSKEKLPLDARIEWAEVVSPHKDNDDAKDRSCGRMSIRLLHNGDCYGMSGSMETSINVGTQIAIIDMRVFVPEVISVLSTFANESFPNYLNRIPFIASLINNGASDAPAPFYYEISMSIDVAVRNAITASSIEVIQRLSPERKEQFIREVLHLRPVRNLYGSQLDAFASSLYSDVHCTQGPPGTGKSYIGVCLVLALDRLRKLYQLDGHAVGPIVVLAYKNHALDEFLGDIVELGNRSIRPGQLIRSGKPELPALNEFTERHSYKEKQASTELYFIVQVFKRSYYISREWIACCKLLSSGFDLAMYWKPRYGTTESDTTFCHVTGAVINALYLLESLQSADATLDKYEVMVKLEVSSVSKLSESVSILEPMIASLYENTSHWTPPFGDIDSVYFALWRWVHGQIPPPRCVAITRDMQCTNAAFAGGLYCVELHKCKSLTVCYNERSSNCDYCNNHMCNVANCKYESYDDHKYCDFDMCPGCVYYEESVISAKNPHACQKHQCQKESCDLPMLYPYAYCEHHVCMECVSRNILCNGECDRDSSFCAKHRCHIANCVEKSACESSYCVRHLCRVCYGENVLSGTDANYPASMYCQNHRCQSTDCLKVRLKSSPFCLYHACFICYMRDMPIISIVTEEYPRNTCAKHPLCNHIFRHGTLCNELAGATLYCARHEFSKSPAKSGNMGQCLGIAKKTGMRCKSTNPAVDGVWYCADHIRQATQEHLTAMKKQNEQNSFSDAQQRKSARPEDEFFECQPVAIETIVLCKPVSCSGIYRTRNLPCCSRVATQSPQWLCQLHDGMGIVVPHVTIEDSADVMPVQDNNVAGSHEAANFHSDISSLEQQQLLVADEIKEEWDGDVVEFPILEDIDEAAYDIHPDELMYDENEEEYEENENLQRLREMTEVGADSDGDGSEMEEIGENHDAHNDEPHANSFTMDDVTVDGLRQFFSWSIDGASRINIVTSLLRLAATKLQQLRYECSNILSDARTKYAEANAESYRNAHVIGATVVGAARRLQAIRAAQPFAVVVEEACEVMEPTLISVLAVPSLRKLELIGDHRQLPAFVQTFWFNAAITMPSIKRSLFERLVGERKKHSREHDDSNATLPYSILDEQRRMVPCIADITRPDYEDVVAIKDHPLTQSQRIGDKIVDSSMKNSVLVARKDWIGGGKVVPCVGHNIYFWHLENNSESRAGAGLSACNNTEADAVTALTSWLIFCHIPPASITIITPYKGQRTAIVKKLRAANCLPPYRSNAQDNSSTSLPVSTVDRYQGDENDIVILSLVRTLPGNRFVGLLNRFIVSTSRARLGFYVIGSIDAVTKSNRHREGPAHWVRFIETLRVPYPMNFIEEDENDYRSHAHMNHPRVGQSLPVCCPMHGAQSLVQVRSAADFPMDTWSHLCTLPCNHILKCGHPCNLQCHISAFDEHETNCKQLLQRPCTKHADIPLCCGELNLRKDETVDAGLERYNCTIKIDYRRPECNHSLKLQCHVVAAISLHGKPLPPCKVRVDDFILPSCGHIISRPECCKKQEYAVSPPTCEKEVYYHRPCGCNVNITCHEKSREIAFPVVCTNLVNIQRPRCMHPITLSCNIACELKRRWVYEGALVADDVTVVDSSETYGPPESDLFQSIPSCTMGVQYVNPCGHVKYDVPCVTAFHYAAVKKELECAEIVTFRCPLCNSLLHGSCSLARDAANIKLWSGHDLDENLNFVIRHNALNVKVRADDIPILKRIAKKCNGGVNVVYGCGINHHAHVYCATILQILLGVRQLKPCAITVSRLLSCGHRVDVKCSDRDMMPQPPCVAPPPRDFTYPCGLHTITPRTCSHLKELEDEDNPLCPEIVQCLRYRCGHITTLMCHEANIVQVPRGGNKLQNEEVVAGHAYCEDICSVECNALVAFRRLCGHTAYNVPCHQAFAWARDPETCPPCVEHVVLASPVCNHPINVMCFMLEQFAEWKPWINEPPIFEEVTDTIDHDGNVKICRFLDEDITRPIVPALFEDICDCQQATTVTRHCGHSFMTTCNAAYRGIFEECKEIIDVECPNCANIRKLPCSVYTAEILAGKRYDCKKKVKKLCSICCINTVSVPCCDTVVSCNKSVSGRLECGHEVRWKCGSDIDPRSTGACYVCNDEAWNQYLNSDWNIDELLGDMANRAKSLCGNIGDILEFHALNTNQETHVACRKAILHTYYSCGDKANLPAPPPIPGTSEDMNSYDIIFQGLNSAQQLQQESLCVTDTRYGRGIAANVLSGRPSLKGDTVTLRVGLGYRYNTLKHAPPFCPANNNKGRIPANKKANHQKSVGFDSVLVRESNEVVRYVYWHIASIVPLFTVKIRLRTKCLLCLESMTSEQVVECGNHHTVCFACMIQYIDTSSIPDAIHRSIDSNGNLRCPEPDCNCHYDMMQVAQRGVPNEVFEGLQKLKTDTVTKKNVEKAIAEHEQSLKKQFDEIMKIMDADDREAARVALQITDQILNLRCPRCFQVFHDFDGCFALTCSVCHAGFCAWCLKDCGADAHAHVATCSEKMGTNGVFGTKMEFTQHHKIRRARLLKNRICQELIARLSKELKEYGVTMDEEKQEVLDRERPRQNGLFGIFW